MGQKLYVVLQPQPAGWHRMPHTRVPAAGRVTAELCPGNRFQHVPSRVEADSEGREEGGRGGRGAAGVLVTWVCVWACPAHAGKILDMSLPSSAKGWIDRTSCSKNKIKVCDAEAERKDNPAACRAVTYDTAALSGLGFTHEDTKAQRASFLRAGSSRARKLVHCYMLVSVRRLLPGFIRLPEALCLQLAGSPADNQLGNP